MNEESRRIIRQYKTQIIVLLFTFISVILSYMVVIDLIKVEKGELKKNSYKTKLKSKIAALLVIISAFYFAYSAFETYKKDKSNANFKFLIAALLALVSASIRYIEIFKNDDIEGAEDIL